VGLTAAVVRFDIQQSGATVLDPYPEVFNLFLSPNGKPADGAVWRNTKA
jgi:hypothetical protein